MVKGGLGILNELVSVARLACGGRGDGENLVRRNRSRQRIEPRQGCKRTRYGLFVQRAGVGQATAKTTQHLLVENRNRRPAHAVVDHKAYRVRADVDDPDRPELGRPLAVAFACLHYVADPLFSDSRQLAT